MTSTAKLPSAAMHLKRQVVSLAFSQDGERFASGSLDGSAVLWNTGSWALDQRLLFGPRVADNPEQYTMGQVHAVDFKPFAKKELLAVGAYDRENGQALTIWEKP